MQKEKHILSHKDSLALPSSAEKSVKISLKMCSLGLKHHKPKWKSLICHAEVFGSCSVV